MCSPPDGLADLNSLNIVLFPKISKVRIWLTLEQESPENISLEFISF